MKKIGYIVSVFPSTSATFVLNEMLMLKKDGFKIQVISLRKPHNEIKQEGIKEFLEDIIYIPHIKDGIKEVIKLIFGSLVTFMKNPIKYWKGLKIVIKSNSKNVTYDFFRATYLANQINDIDLEHIHSQFAHAPTNIAYFLKLVCGKEYSFTCHAVDIFVEKNRRLLEKQLTEAKFAVTISKFNINFIKEKIEDELLVSKFNIIRCGINYNNFKPGKDIKKKEKSLKIFSVGRFVEKKGFRYLIEAIEILNEKNINIECIIAGDGPLHKEILEMIEKKELKSKIKLLGAIDSERVKMQLLEADIFILPCVQAENQDMDGIPVSIMEAMAYEIPVISTNISGIPELIDNNKSGILVEEKNSKQLANAIEDLENDCTKRIKYGKEARKKIIKEFGIEENMEKLKNLFREWI